MRKFTICYDIISIDGVDIEAETALAALEAFMRTNRGDASIIPTDVMDAETNETILTITEETRIVIGELIKEKVNE